MALVKKPAIFQVAGYQNSGKTTLVMKLLQALKEKGKLVATIKHHGHGGKPDVKDDKDSAMHIESGAMASIVEGDGRLLLQAEAKKWTLHQQIELLRLLHPDYILIEGHKHETFPKLVLLRSLEDKHLLQDLTNIQVVLYWKEDVKELSKDYHDIPFFSIKEEEGMQWIMANIGRFEKAPKNRHN